MKKKLVYIVGIGGAGTSALARLYKAQGYDVVGSDDGDGFYTASLIQEGVTVYDHFSQENIPDDITFAVHSTAFDKTNCEISAIKKRGVRLLSYPQALGALTQEKYTIAVCGTHGKTTTTALLTHALLGAGRDPSALVGTRVVGWSGGACIGTGREFIIEADEYQNKLQYYHPQAVILTNVDYDHPDFFENFDVYKKVFRDFVQRIPQYGTLVVCIDDRDAYALSRAASCRVITYGEHADADARIQKRIHDAHGQRITVLYRGITTTLRTKFFGRHYAQNIVAAWVMSSTLAQDMEGAQAGLEHFRGVARRSEHRGTYHGAVMIDDYAHHPVEIRATIQAMRDAYPGRNLIVAFHPHTFSRTEALLDDFASALAMADHVIILDIYSSAREQGGTISAHDVVTAVDTVAINKAEHIPTVRMLAQWAQKNLGPQDLFVTLGAGDIWKVHDLIVHKHLKNTDEH